jgi:hypothetical protein
MIYLFKTGALNRVTSTPCYIQMCFLKKGFKYYLVVSDIISVSDIVETEKYLMKLSGKMTWTQIFISLYVGSRYIRSRYTQSTL